MSSCPSGRTVTSQVHFEAVGRRRRELRFGPVPVQVVIPGRLPRITKLMALAIRFEHLLAVGAVADQAELARLGHVTRARVTQIMNLLHLAPDIQEAILDLPRVTEGRDPITERDLRPIAAQVDWGRQREMWAAQISVANLQ
jgi:hypothetical protein